MNEVRIGKWHNYLAGGGNPDRLIHGDADDQSVHDNAAIQDATDDLH